MSDMPRPLIDTPDVSHELHISNELYESHINDMPRPQIDDSEARLCMSYRRHEPRKTPHVSHELHLSPELYKSHMSDMPRPLSDTPIYESQTAYKSRTIYESHKFS